MYARRLKLFFDGGCRPNPGTMEVAVFARNVIYHVPDIGRGTNSDAEWLALIHALKVARSLGESDIELIGDSALVVHQAKGEWKCRGPELQAHLADYKALAGAFAQIRIRHVGRSHNLAGIALEGIRAGLAMNHRLSDVVL